MTRAEIIAELRRSAVEDADPWQGCCMDAFCFAVEWLCVGGNESMRAAPAKLVGTFFLIVAHALEDEC